MTTSDDGLREIQLNGKQLVFLFMAVTVVSVVIFLCGVLVGRGVQGRVQTVEPPAVREAETPPDASAAAPARPPSGPTKVDDLGYPSRLTSAGPDSERLVTPSDPPKNAPSVPVTPSPAVPTTTAPLPRQTSAEPARAPSEAKGDAGTAEPIPAEPQDDGIAIQVAALRGRAEADAVVARLKGKGYAAYLVAALPGQPSGFRVRVGKFKTRTEAEKVAARLEREEQFKPWITR